MASRRRRRELAASLRGRGVHALLDVHRLAVWGGVLRLHEDGALVMIVIGCGKAKLAEEAEAAELYTGSLFVAARRYAVASGQRWAILSAEHGLVLPGERLKPYDRKLRMKGVELTSWALRCADRFVQVFGTDVGIVEVLAGHPYAWPFRNELFWVAGGVQTTEPLEGLGLGARLQWLKLGRERMEVRA